MKRKFDAKLRKVGNSFIITIPRDTINRFKLKQGSFLTVNLDFSDLKKPEAVALFNPAFRLIDNFLNQEGKIVREERLLSSVT